MDGVLSVIVTCCITTIVGAVAGGVVGYLISQAKGMAKSKKADQVILKSVARSQLEEWHRLYVIEKKPLSMKRHEEIVELHTAYNTKGGNGTGDKLFEELMEVLIQVIA